MVGEITYGITVREAARNGNNIQGISNFMNYRYLVIYAGHLSRKLYITKFVYSHQVIFCVAGGRYRSFVDCCRLGLSLFQG